MNDKIRPVQERLAQLEGMTTFKDMREGVGGFANVTMADLMAGLAIMRSKEEQKILLGPHCLETYFGSTQVHRRLLVSTYLSNTRVDVRYIVPHRMGATLAAQALAGVQFTHEQDREFAFICNCRTDALKDLRRQALAWFDNVIDEAIPAFADAVRSVVMTRMQRRAMNFLEASIAHDQRNAAAA